MSDETVVESDFSVDFNNVVESVTDIMLSVVTDTKMNAEEAKKQIRDFLIEIRPDIEAALALAVSMPSKTHKMTIKFLYNTAVLRAGRISQGFIAKEKNLFAAAIVTVIRTLIAAGVTALV